MRTVSQYLFILFLAFISSSAKAQLDTFYYLKNFELQKSTYIGQPFSTLLNAMTEIQPNNISSSGPFHNRQIQTTTRFFFCGKEDRYGKNVIIMIIKWQDSISTTDVKYYENRNDFHFTNEERSFFGSKIIKDIIILRRM